MLDLDLGVSRMLSVRCWAEANGSSGLLTLGKWYVRGEVRDGAHRVRASPTPSGSLVEMGSLAEF